MRVALEAEIARLKGGSLQSASMQRGPVVQTERPVVETEEPVVETEGACGPQCGRLCHSSIGP